MDREYMITLSDLHLKPDTYYVCMDVLRFVLNEARKRRASVGFLGDFFHTVHSKGTIPVDLLNCLLRFFSDEWDVPMICIPGNHDMSDSDEKVHALTFLPLINPLIRVCEEPTYINRQLWIPWRRNVSTVCNIVKDCVENDKADVIFAHLDLVGFTLAGTHVSSHGVDPGVFPPGLPVYTGHYHKPQTRGSIRYLGSPYPVSMAEHDHGKFIYVLDTRTWMVSEELPVQFGPKFHKWTLNEFRDNRRELKMNDHLVLSDVPSEVDIEWLVDNGINYKVNKKPTIVKKSRIVYSFDMVPMDFFDAYCKLNNINMLSATYKRASEWILNNHHTLTETAIPTEVILQKLELVNFGPFMGAHVLDLEKMGGIVLVSGSSVSSANSNGTGKSMLVAGSILWVCTGLIDNRITTCTPDTCVISKGATLCSVSLTGLSNGHNWKINRSLKNIGNKRVSSLRIEIDGASVTCATITGTQRKLSNVIFGLPVMTSKQLYDWMVSQFIWSQCSPHHWTDLSDTACRHSIHYFCQLYYYGDMWQRGFKMSLTNVQRLKHELDILNSEKTILDTQLINIVELNGYIKKSAAEWDSEHSSALIVIEQEINDMTQKINAQVTQITTYPDTSADESQHNVLVNEHEQIRMKMNSIERTFRAVNTHVHTVCPEIDPNRLISYNKILYDLEKEIIQYKSKQDSIRETIQHLDKTSVCLACNRTYDNIGDITNQRKKLQLELCLADTNTTGLEDKRNSILTEKKKIEKSIQMNINNTLSLEYINLKQREIEIRTRVQTGELFIQHKKHKQTTFNQERQYHSDNQSKLTQLTHICAEMKCRTNPHLIKILDTDVRLLDTQTQIAHIHRKQTNLETDMGHFNTIAEWFGPTGIQAHLVEQTIYNLAEQTSEYLVHLFGCDDITVDYNINDDGKITRSVKADSIPGAWSGGQYRRLQLASYFAWISLSKSTLSMIILDEPGNSMDNDGIQRLQHTLKKYFNTRTCIFITHDMMQHRDTSAYDYSIHISKTDTSRILIQNLNDEVAKVYTRKRKKIE
jgi:hypothetical protein